MYYLWAIFKGKMYSNKNKSFLGEKSSIELIGLNKIWLGEEFSHIVGKEEKGIRNQKKIYALKEKSSFDLQNRSKVNIIGGGGVYSR